MRASRGLAVLRGWVAVGDGASARWSWDVVSRNRSPRLGILMTLCLLEIVGWVLYAIVEDVNRLTHSISLE